MASITMTTSFLGSAVTSAAAVSRSTNRPMSIVAKASANSSDAENLISTARSSTTNGRRDLMFAAAAASICSVALAAVAEEPNRGTEEAKKKYGPVCVTMPTARVCNKIA